MMKRCIPFPSSQIKGILEPSMKTAGVGLTIQSRATSTGLKSSCCIYRSCIPIAYQNSKMCDSLPKYKRMPN